jgi:hypothetical protein
VTGRSSPTASRPPYLNRRLAGQQLEALAEKLTDGSLVPFILHAVWSKKLSPKERQEIQKLLERKK